MFAEQKEYQTTLQWVRVKMHLLTVQYHPENVLYRYMEDLAYKNIHEVSQFVTTLNSKKSCSIDLIPKKVMKFDFCPFCILSHYDNSENTSLRLDTEFSSKSVTHPSGKVMTHPLRRKNLIYLKFHPGNLRQTH